MILHSDSGYCMPFEERNGEVTMSLGYGKQKHPHTGESFFHHGVDFKVRNYLLSAVATGKVTGLGNDANLNSLLGGNSDRKASNHKEEEKQQEVEQTNTVSRRR